jgi:hypothetical protein
MADVYDPLGIAKESNTAGYDPLGIAKPESPKEEGLWEGLVKPTLKATGRVVGTAAGGLMAMPYAGLRGISSGTGALLTGKDALAEANKEYERIMRKTNLIETPEEEQSLNYLNVLMKPFEMAGKGSAGLAELATTGDISKAADVVEGRSGGSNILVPTFGTIGEASAMFGLPKGVGKAKNLVRSVISERKARVATAAAAEAEATAGATRRAEAASVERAKAAAADKAKVTQLSEPYDPLGIAEPKEDIAATAKIEAAAAEATRTEPAGEPGRLATIYGGLKDKLPTWEADRLEGLVSKDPALWDAEDRLFAKDMEARYRGEEPAVKITEPEYAGKRGAPERVEPMLTGVDRSALKARGFSDEKIRKMSAKEADAALSKPVELKAGKLEFPKSVLETPEWAKKAGEPERSIIDQAAEEKQSRVAEEVKQETTDVTSETKPEGWKSVVKGPDGENYIGEPGETHAQIIERNGLDWGTETGFLDETGKYLRQTESPEVTKLLKKPVQQRVPAVKIDGKVYTADLPDGSTHNMVWNDIPEGAIAKAKSVESGWAYGDGSEFGKKKIDLRAEKLTAKFVSIDRPQSVTDINGDRVTLDPNEPFYRIEKNEDGTVTLVDGKEVTTSLKELGNIVGTFSKEPNPAAGGMTPEMRAKRESGKLYSDPFGLQAVGDKISSASSAIKEFVQDLKNAKLIVEPYDPHTFGDRLPDHQSAGIPEEAPVLSSTKDASRSADLLSPHVTFGRRFSLWNRPEIDMQKSHMASLENTKNSVAYVNNALKGVKDSFQDILKTVKPLFDKHRDLLERFETIQDQKSTAQRTLNKIPQSAEYEKLQKQTSKLARQRAKVQEKLDKKDTPESRDKFLFEKEQRTRYLEEQLASMKNEKAKLRKEGYAKALEKVKSQTYEKEIKDLMSQAKRIDRAIDLRSDKMDMIEYKLKGVKNYNELKNKIRVLDAQAKELDPEFKAMSAEFDPMLKDLAIKHADARVYLEASGELPEGVKLSKEEQHSADQLRKYMEDRRDKLEAVGIPVIREKAYMTHMWRQLLEDDTVLDMIGKFQEKPTLLRFMSRLPGSRPWLPSAHEAMRAYVPTVEYKLAYQPFLDRWRPFVDQIKQPRLKKFMDDWIQSNMSRRDIGTWEKLLNVGVGIEYARTIGLSLSVGVKHGMKVLGTPAEYGFLNTLEALPQAAIVPYQAAMEFGKLHFEDFSKIAKDLGIGEKNDQLLLFRHYIAQSDLVRMMTEIPGVENLDRSLFSKGALKTGSATFNVAKKTIGRILAQPVKTVEALENGVSVFAGTIAGKAKGIDPLVIERRIWEAVFDVNFRSGVDQPLMQRKSTLGRAATMFQTTPLKLQERLYKWVHDSVSVTKDPITGKTEIGKRDAFGTHGGSKLARFLLMVGTAELIARENDTSILGMAMAHLPLIGEVLEPTREGIGFKVRGLPGEPPLKPMTASPTTQFAYQIAQKGPYEGTREHLKGGFNFLSKIHKAGTEEYPTKYDSATKYMLGLPRIAGENDLETVTEKQKEERKDQTEHITELAAKYARGDDEAVDQALDYIATQPEEEQENLAKRFVTTAKIHTTTTHKWWQGLQNLSPENKAKVFYEKYKNASEEVQDQMLEDVSKLSGFTSERFEEAMRKEILKGEEKEEGEAMKPKGKFSIRPGTKNEATVYD